MIIEPATREELPRILELLEEADLPVAGVNDAESFLVARDAAGIVGCIGLEAYGDVGLLRSLVVRAETRGSGLGKRLVERLLDRAREQGIASVYLLTTTADEYFPRFGFERIGSIDSIGDAEVDPRLRASTEFRGACPDSAVCMRKRL